MNRCIALLLLLSWVAQADDIDALLPEPNSAQVFLHVFIDPGDTDADTAVCTTLAACAPPLMTEAAYGHLQAGHAGGEGVYGLEIFKAVLTTVLEDSRFNAIRIALLLPNHHSNSAEKGDGLTGGGTLLQGYRSLHESRRETLSTLGQIPTLSAANAHAMQPLEAHFEWYRYLQGGTVALGMNTAGNFGDARPQPDFDSQIISQGTYLSPVPPTVTCPRFFSIQFSNDFDAGQQAGDLHPTITNHMPLPASVGFEGMLAYLHDSTTDLVPAVSAKVHIQQSWLVSGQAGLARANAYAAAAGRAQVLSLENPRALQQALTQALLSSLAVNGGALHSYAVLDSAVHGGKSNSLFLPLNQVHSAAPWWGNIKKLNLRDAANDSDSAPDALEGILDSVVDARGEPAFDATGNNRGKLRFDALTLWTDSENLPPGDDVSIPRGADGAVVARGGAGQKLDGFVSYSTVPGESVGYVIGDSNADQSIDGYGARQLFYEVSQSLDLAPLNSDASTVAALRLVLDPASELSDGELLNLLRWARGQDVDAGNTQARDWLIGEVLHSRPSVLNYGATQGYSNDNPNIRLMYGSGDGLFHIVENTDTAGRESGREVFAFYPQDTLGKLRARRNNTPPHRMFRYGVDGAPVVLTVDRNRDGTLDYTDGDEAYVYFGMRRGGSRYYALDISNPNAVPALKWKISTTTGGAFDELGLTFSTPVVGKVLYGTEPVDALIFGAGYAGGWNDAATTRLGKDAGAADDVIGNAIYVVNARSGELIWKAVRGKAGERSDNHFGHAGLVDSIPSAVSVLTTAEGVVHRVYVGDTGGALWRVDLPPNIDGADRHREQHWFISKLAELGADALGPAGEEQLDRRFFHAPDIVRSRDGQGNFDGILIQSGDRARPNETQVHNALFYVKDRHVVSGSLAVRMENNDAMPAGRIRLDELPNQTDCVLGTEMMIEDGMELPCASRNLAKGWQVAYLQPGEKGLSTPLVDGGRVFASTFVPGDPQTCPMRQGRGQMYVLTLADGSAVENEQRAYELDLGIPTAPSLIGNSIYIPAGGIDLYDVDGDRVRDKKSLLPSRAAKRYDIYWHEPGADSL